jgi:hypothetical protein
MGDLAKDVRDGSIDGRLPCARAFDIAELNHAAPPQVRETADRLGARISRCQLGLFGFEDLGERRLVRALPKVPESLASRVRESLIDGRLPCAAAWRLADDEGLPRLLLGCACETIGVRVAPCQLGCF